MLISVLTDYRYLWHVDVVRAHRSLLLNFVDKDGLFVRYCLFDAVGIFHG